eukprot:TRINITY_DN4697_c0_g3_i1.p1 TRINITY_DN4697_c0_g3~~TRINITY_DN4697_c0_g3_i1.p1  ORF type:complete len:811 (-),score=126.71 TRINITY_DN4697_c0_g3_i1:2-2434(-)
MTCLMHARLSRCKARATLAAGVLAQQCLRLAVTAREIAFRLERVLVSGSSAHHSVSCLVKLLTPAVSERQEGKGKQGTLPNMSDLFCRDATKLKAMLTFSFAPHFMVGNIEIGESSDAKRMLCECLRQGMDPSRSVSVPFDSADALESNEAEQKLKESIRDLAPDTTLGFAWAENSQRVAMLEFTEKDDDDVPCDQILLDAEDGLPHPMPKTAQLLSALAPQHGGSFALSKASSKDSGDAASDTKRGLAVRRPASPYELVWQAAIVQPSSQTSAGSKGKGHGKSKSSQRCVAATSRRERMHGAFASCEVDVMSEPADGWGPEKPPLPRTKCVLGTYVDAQTLGQSSSSLLSGVTILSAEADNIVALALLIAALGYDHEASFELDPSSRAIVAVRLPGQMYIRLSDFGPGAILRASDIVLINKLRTALSNAVDNTITKKQIDTGAHCDKAIATASAALKALFTTLRASREGNGQNSSPAFTIRVPIRQQVGSGVAPILYPLVGLEALDGSSKLDESHGDGYEGADVNDEDEGGANEEEEGDVCDEEIIVADEAVLAQGIEKEEATPDPEVEDVYVEQQECELQQEDANDVDEEGEEEEEVSDDAEQEAVEENGDDAPEDVDCDNSEEEVENEHLAGAAKPPEPAGPPPRRPGRAPTAKASAPRGLEQGLSLRPLLRATWPAAPSISGLRAQSPRPPTAKAMPMRSNAARRPLEAPGRSLDAPRAPLGAGAGSILKSRWPGRADEPPTKRLKATPKVGPPVGSAPSVRPGVPFRSSALLRGVGGPPARAATARGSAGTLLGVSARPPKFRQP